jgi:hypothetical protein
MFNGKIISFIKRIVFFFGIKMKHVKMPLIQDQANSFQHVKNFKTLNEKQVKMLMNNISVAWFPNRIQDQNE